MHEGQAAELGSVAKGFGSRAPSKVWLSKLPAPRQATARLEESTSPMLQKMFRSGVVRNVKSEQSAEN